MNRSPAVAGVLAVAFPGLGHLFAGANRRALALAAMCAALLHGVVEGDGGPVAAALPALWLFGVVNAIRIAEEMGSGGPNRAKEPDLDSRWSAALVVAGVLAVLSAIPEARWALNLWPLLLVWVGVQRLRDRPVVPWFPAGGRNGTEAGPATRNAADTAAKTEGAMQTKQEAAHGTE